MSHKRVIVVGAGPGGLTAAMLLASRGYVVAVFEKEPRVGGRNASIELDGFTFDLGPTFLLMKSILEEIFELTGRSVDDYLEIRSLDPLYRLVFGRRPEVYETELGEKFVQAAAAAPADSALSPWAQYAQLLLLSNEFLFID